MNLMKLLNKTIKIIKENPRSILSITYSKKFFQVLFSKTENGSFYNPYNKYEYNQWLKRQSKQISDLNSTFCPRISIIIPVYNTKKEYLEACIESALHQNYSNFEICIVDDCSTNNDTIECLIRYQNHPRIKFYKNLNNRNISETTNIGIKMADGEFISLLDHDDVLEYNALSYVASVLNQNKKLDFIYTDEDKINDRDELYDPFFKPDWSPDTILSYNYICHFVTIRKTLIENVGGFRSKYDGCQDYDLFLRVSEKTDNIYHISKILYHWRSCNTSTAMCLENKENITEKTKRMLQETIKRRRLQAEVKILPEKNYYIEYKLRDKYKVSIIIPTKDHPEMLENCVNSIFEKTNYKNFEVIIINNNSKELKTFSLFTRLKKNPRITIIDLNCEFNYSYINNYAVSKCNGEYIVLLNNDTKVISSSWITEMLRFASQKHVGTVGVKLLYSDNTIQHGGVIIGLGGVAGHAFIGESRSYSGIFSNLKVVRNVGANTAACLMIEKKKYMQVGGLDTNIKVAFNDVDFNLKLLENGYYNVFLPNVELYHYESKSRGLEDTKEKIERFNNEVDYMKKKWCEQLKRDPFYNDNLSYKYNYKLDIK